MLRCEAQLELTLILARVVTVLSFGMLSDRSTFTSTDARATDLHCCCCQGGSVTSSIGVLVAAEDVLTQQQQPECV